MPHFVKTPADEARWAKAKQAISKASKKPENQFKDAHWAQVNALYQKMAKPHMDDGGMVWNRTPGDQVDMNKGGMVSGNPMPMAPMVSPQANMNANQAINPGKPASGVSYYDKGGMVGGNPMPQAPMVSPQANMNARQSVNPGMPQNVSPHFNGGGAVNMKNGGKVGGKPKVSGNVDTLRNDTVDAKLSPGEVVLPRSVTQSPNAPQKAAQFMQSPQVQNPAAMEAMQRIKDNGGISPNVLAALHMAHPAAAQALAEANGIHPAVAPALAQMMQQKMARGGPVMNRNKAIQSTLGAPNMPQARVMPKMPHSNPMLSPVPNMADGGRVDGMIPMMGNNPMPSAPMVYPNSRGDASEAIMRGPDPFYTPAPVMPPQSLAKGGMVGGNPMPRAPMVNPSAMGDSEAYGNPGKPASDVKCYADGGPICMSHGGMMMADGGMCYASGGHVAKLGSGARFHELAAKVRREGYSPESANAIAASAGRKKYGDAKMNKLAHHEK